MSWDQQAGYKETFESMTYELERTARMKNFVRIYRWEAGLKQYELASRIGCSSPYLSQVENFRKEPDDTFKEKLAEVLHTPREILFPENDFRTVGEWTTEKLGNETTVEWAGKS